MAQQALTKTSPYRYAWEEALALHNRLLFQIFLKHWISFYHPELTPVGQMYTVFLDLLGETVGDVTREVSNALSNVGIGFGCLVYDHMPANQQAAFLMRLKDIQRRDAINHIELTYEQTVILQRMVSLVNLAYDPMQTVFQFSEIESKPPKGIQLPNY